MNTLCKISVQPFAIYFESERENVNLLAYEQMIPQIDEWFQ